MSKSLQKSFEVAKSYVFVDDKSFHLLEHRRMSRVVVGSVYLARTNYSDRRLSLYHSPCLHRRSMRTQKYVVSNIERILHISCGMIGRNIEHLKTKFIKLYLRSFSKRESQRSENFYYFIGDQSAGVQAASLLSLAVKSDVDALFKHLCINLCLFKLLGLILRDLSYYVSCLVDVLSYKRSLLRRKIFHTPQKLSQLSALAKIFDLDAVDES